MNRQLLIGALSVLCLLALVLGVAVGAAGFRADVVSGLLAGDEILATLRAPRVLLAASVGGSLALAGVCLQALLRNDLADPYILGMAGGASAGAVGSLSLWPSGPPGLAAALGATLATTLVRAVARGPHDPGRLLLAGVSVSAVLGSATGLVLVLAPGERLLRSATYWLFGGFGTPSPTGVILPAAALLLAYALLRQRAERMDRLLLGDDVSASLGTAPAPIRRFLLVVAVVLTASSVAAAGLIGFVGLLAPHAARRLVGGLHRGLLPVSALLGALLVVLADMAARTTFAPREVPVGLITAMLGGPLFLWLVAGRRQWA